MKICTVCKFEKELSSFYPKMGRCKSCHKELCMKWQRAHPEKVKTANQKWRDKPGSREKENEASRRWNSENETYRKFKSLVRWLHKSYKITLNEYLDMYTNQNFGCAICGGISVRGLDIDHDHITGKMRKLLCIPCNTSVGLLKENPELAEKLASYLRSHQQKDYAALPPVFPEPKSID